MWQDCVNVSLSYNRVMATERQILKLIGHPFFERMLVLRQVFDRFEETERHRGGVYHDGEIELRCRAAKSEVADDESESLVDYEMETGIIETTHRLCQIVLLYSTLESFCTGTLGREEAWGIDGSLVRDAKKRAKDARENFVLTLLDEAKQRGMKSPVWPSHQPYIKAFVVLRNHLVHEGLEVTDKLRENLQPFLHSIEQFPGSTPKQKLEGLGEDGSLVQITSAFVAKLFCLLEDLAAALIIPVDREERDIHS